MGSNRRYPDAADRHRRERERDTAMASIAPLSLTDAELDLKVQPLTKTPIPQPVRAWVRYGDTALQVDGRVVAWTPRAVAVEWKTPAGDIHRAWLWSSAVEPH